MMKNGHYQVMTEATVSANDRIRSQNMKQNCLISYCEHQDKQINIHQLNIHCE